MLKRITACVLIVVMMLSLCMVNVYATEEIGPFPTSTEEYGETIIFYEENSWTVYYYRFGIVPAHYTDRIDNYVFFTGAINLLYPLGIYAEKGDKVLTLEEAYDSGEVTNLDALFNAMDSSDKREKILLTVTISGDSDLDGEITIKDAVKIQKSIARLESLVGSSTEENEFNIYACDYNLDNKVTLSDVLALQLYLARKV